MQKIFSLVSMIAIALLAFSGCALSEPKAVSISSLVSSETATEIARAGISASGGSNEIDDIECNVSGNTITYKFYYNSLFTEDTVNDDVIDIWKQYASDASEASIDWFKEINDSLDSNSFLLTPEMRFEFYNSDGSVLFYETGKRINYQTNTVSDGIKESVEKSAHELGLE